jgi:hypothetical protein
VDTATPWPSLRPGASGAAGATEMGSEFKLLASVILAAQAAAQVAAHCLPRSHKRVQATHLCRVSCLAGCCRLGNATFADSMELRRVMGMK